MVSDYNTAVNPNLITDLGGCDHHCQLMAIHTDDVAGGFSNGVSIVISVLGPVSCPPHNRGVFFRPQWLKSPHNPNWLWPVGAMACGRRHKRKFIYNWRWLHKEGKSGCGYMALVEASFFLDSVIGLLNFPEFFLGEFRKLFRQSLGNDAVRMIFHY